MASATGWTRVRDVADGAGAPPKPDRDAPILEVRDLRTYIDTDAGVVRAVDGVSFSVMPGETLGIVGESGSGKSVTALSIMKLLPEQGRIAGGEIVFRGRDILGMTGDEVRSLRGSRIAMVFQDPMTSLNPVRRVSDQLVEAAIVHGRHDKASALRRAIALLGRMGISSPERQINSYPHQFSGGMRQRVMLAMGFSNDPLLLLADEPTTALDVTIQAQILDLLRELNSDFGAAIILISHDLGVIANVCRRVVVMYAGEEVEEGTTEALLASPRHPYTWALLNAAPRLDRYTPGQRRLTTIEGTPPDPLNWPKGCRFAPRCPFKIEKCAEHPPLLPSGDGRSSRCWVTQGGRSLPPAAAQVAATSGLVWSRPAATGETILELEGLVKHFSVPKPSLFAPRQAVHAVDGVDLTVRKGETVGLVGESGSGKSTLARLIVRIHEPDAGTIRFAGQDITHASGAAIRPLRRRMQMIFQDPYASLNPRMTAGDIVAEPLRFHGITADEAATSARVGELLGLVGLSPSAAAKYPHEFSGGQRQRISIARALAVSPDLIVADEPISSLDVNIQAQIINLLIDLQERLSLTYLFIAHDLAVVRHVSDRIVVLYLGKVMEIASSGNLFDQPLHPYTRSLISAVPIPDAAVERQRQRMHLQGEPPSALAPPSGCRFRTRCPIAAPRCASEMPPLVEHRPGQWAACHFPGQV
ncbi:MAG: ABC transporter ATP-binding protein [Alphaproteobacteria bacterium]|nr:ABC transporter ATP-binding protein [Alphaproteobacteria bacterium]